MRDTRIQSIRMRRPH